MFIHIILWRYKLTSQVFYFPINQYCFHTVLNEISVVALPFSVWSVPGELHNPNVCAELLLKLSMVCNLVNNSFTGTTYAERHHLYLSGLCFVHTFIQWPRRNSHFWLHCHVTAMPACRLQSEWSTCGLPPFSNLKLSLNFNMWCTKLNTAWEHIITAGDAHVQEPLWLKIKEVFA